MKMRDLGLLLAGAFGAAVLSVALPSLVNNAQAQSAAAYGTTGANPVIVTSAGAVNNGSTGNGANAGIIVINDPVGKKITAVSYQFTYTAAVGGTTNTTLGFSAKQVFTY